jgi:Concanavalin A-like lectin/glucanases superfamily
VERRAVVIFRAAMRIGIPIAGLLTSHVTVAQPCASVPDGLVSWWRAEGNARDLTGQNDGVLKNGASAEDVGKVGKAFGFDGNDDIVLVPDSPSLRFDETSSFTIELWWNRSLANLPFHVVGKRPSCNPPPFYQVAADASYPASIRVLNEWIHVAVVSDAATGLERRYVNGSEISTAARVDPGPTNADFLIGGSGSCAHFGGLVDEVSVYDRVLTTAEIQAIWAAGSSGKCVPPVPVGGSVNGITGRKSIECTNLTTGDRVSFKQSATKWNCESKGLTVNPGDKIEQKVTGATPAP